MKVISIQERQKSNNKLRGAKACKAEEVRKYFANPKIEIEVFSCIICSLDFKNISCALFLLHTKTVNGVVSWYILALHHLIHFIACVSFLSVFFFFFSFFCVSSITCWGNNVSFWENLNQSSWVPKWSFKEWVCTALFSN